MGHGVEYFIACMSALHMYALLNDGATAQYEHAPAAPFLNKLLINIEFSVLNSNIKSQQIRNSLQAPL